MLKLSILVCILLFQSLECSYFAAFNGLFVPHASRQNGEYLELYPLDYGCEDNERFAGKMKAFLKRSWLSSQRPVDPFVTWLYRYLDVGDETCLERLKPFYVSERRIDINPTLIILQYRQSTSVI